MKIPHDVKIDKVLSKDKMRMSLSAAYLDLEVKDKPVLVATDGRILAVVPVEVEKDDIAGHVSVEALKAARTKGNLDTILLNEDEKLMNCAFPRKKELGNFPAWRMIDKPLTKIALTVSINVDLLKALADALGDSEHVTLRFKPHKTSEYLDNIEVVGKYGHGQIMPRRGAIERAEGKE